MVISRGTGEANNLSPKKRDRNPGHRQVLPPLQGGLNFLWAYNTKAAPWYLKKDAVNALFRRFKCGMVHMCVLGSLLAYRGALLNLTDFTSEEFGREEPLFTHVQTWQENRLRLLQLRKHGIFLLYLTQISAPPRREAAGLGLAHLKASFGNLPASLLCIEQESTPLNKNCKSAHWPPSVHTYQSFLLWYLKN